MNDDGLQADTSTRDEGLTPGQRALWRWFRLIGLPLIALAFIGLAIAVLQRPSGGSGAVAVPGADVDTSSGSGPVEGQTAPDLTLTAMDGAVYHLAELRGKPVVLNFWATWCGPCRQEMPAFEEVHRERGDDVIILAINAGEGTSLIEPFVQRYKLSLPVLLDRDNAVNHRYRVTALPTTVLIDRDGRVDGIRVGPYSRDLLRARIEQLLGE